VDRPAARRGDGEPAPTSEIEHPPLGGLELDLGQNAGLPASMRSTPKISGWSLTL
jgi:hypothetical protein